MTGLYFCLAACSKCGKVACIYLNYIQTAEIGISGEIVSLANKIGGLLVALLLCSVFIAVFQNCLNIIIAQIGER